MGTRNFLKERKKHSIEKNFFLSRPSHRQQLTRNVLLCDKAVKYKFVTRPLDNSQVLCSPNRVHFYEEQDPMSAFLISLPIDPHTEKG